MTHSSISVVLISVHTPYRICKMLEILTKHIEMSCCFHLALPWSVWQRWCQYLVSADFLKGPVDVEERHVVALAGDELPADGEDVVSARGRIVEDWVDGEERDDGQNLLSAGEIRRDQQSLWRRRRTRLQPENNRFTAPHQLKSLQYRYLKRYVFNILIFI